METTIDLGAALQKEHTEKASPYTYAVEDWFDVKEEMSPLWFRHWEEVAVNKDKIALDPDLDAYDAMASVGMLHIVVVRKEGKIIAYHFTIIRPHLHYKTSISAFTDIYYCSPAHRAGRIPFRMFMYVESTLRAKGVQKAFTGTKLSLDAGPLFEKMGWTETERLYVKMLGD